MKKTTDRKWVYSPKNKEDEIKQLANETGLTTLQASIMINRGFDTAEKVIGHLDATIEHDTRLMKDAEKACDLIIKHIKAGNPIVNYSDYDCDGWGSAVASYHLFKNLGVEINTFQNTAAIGYGISKTGIDKMLEAYPDTKLIITTDNGIVAFEAAAYAKSLGIDIIITDHHEPQADGSVPPADAVVNPKQLDCNYPFKHLCGAGVIFKLMMLLYFKLGKNPLDCYECLDVVAVSTIADVVPLIGENRAIVKEGLKRIKEEKRSAFKAMRETFVDSYYEPEIHVKTIAFSYAPAINASRRMLGTIALPVELFKMDNDEVNYKRMLEFAKYMKDVNDERKLLTKSLTQGARAMWLQKDDDVKVAVIYHESMKEGLAGLVAGRIKEEFTRPSIVLAPDDEHPGMCRGSARSIPGFDLKKVLDRIQEEDNLLVKYGGHELAAGLSIMENNIEAFEKKINQIADELLNDDDFINYVHIDYAYKEDDVDLSLLDEIKFLAPYGQGFQAPVIGVREFEPKNIKKSGDAGQHISLKGNQLGITSWYGADEFEKLEKPYKLWVIGSLEFDAYTRGVKLMAEPMDIKNKK